MLRRGLIWTSYDICAAALSKSNSSFYQYWTPYGVLLYNGNSESLRRVVIRSSYCDSTAALLKLEHCAMNIGPLPSAGRPYGVLLYYGVSDVVPRFDGDCLK